MEYIVKVFMDGRSQTIRLPKEYQFDCDEVCITKQDDQIIITPANPTWDDFFSQNSAFDNDYLSDRDQGIPQERN